MKRYWIVGLLACGLAGSAGANGWGDATLGGDDSTDEASVAPDAAAAQELVTQIHHTNLREIAMARLARERTSSDQVRAYADRVLKDHLFADKKLRDLVEESEIELIEPPPGGPAGEVPPEIAESRGDRFDELFLRWMREGHRAAIESMRRLVASVEPDTRLGILAARLVPILEQHHALAITLEPKQSKEG